MAANPLNEEPCQVKIRSYGPKPEPDPDSHSSHDSTQVKESQCKLKTTNYKKLTSKYFREDAMRREERRAQANFKDLRQEYLKQNKLFVDDSFPPVNQSINFNGITTKQYDWKRPSEIVQDPRFFVEGATRFDIQQGELGDCWLLAAIAALTLNQKLFHYVVPCDQGFQFKYAGIFHFRFWQYGKWEEIVIDDLLPTYRGRLVFMHSRTKNEFWCALLEKAYAKLYGGYEALRGGNVGESMVDLTGGVVETVDLRNPPKNLFTIMEKSSKRGAMMGCGIEPDDPNFPCEGRLANGLIARHAYSVTKATTIPYYKSHAELLRLYNPWGNEAEWKGPWSDESDEWKSLSDEEKERLGIVFDDDGEFYLPFKDFVANFTALDVCDVTPDVFVSQTEYDSDDEDSNLKQVMQRQWKMRTLEGEWTPGVTAGGCRNYIDTFAKNPQKVVLLDKTENGTDKCTLVVSLMQKFVRQRKRYGVDFVPIGFAVYKLPPGVVPGEPLSTDFFRCNISCGKAPYFLNIREVSYHFKFSPGVYVVIPSTFEPNYGAEFLLRVFTESP